jgi:hypothetical protein
MQKQTLNVFEQSNLKVREVEKRETSNEKERYIDRCKNKNDGLFYLCAAILCSSHKILNKNL